MKTFSLKIILTLSVSLMCIMTNAQIATWSFNNVLTGVGSAISLPGNASLGTAIGVGSFNGGTVYYGEGGWPSGSLDLNAYLEFSITPAASQTITVSSLVMQIRRSTTGSSGSGPNNWSLRSNLDGYTADLSGGVLALNSTPATTVSLGAQFMNLSSKVIFRLYGYNATISTGGLNRFVYDNIVAGGSSVLPVVLDYFKVKSINNTADISWKLAGDGNLSSLNIERASDGTNFETIKRYSADQANTLTAFEDLDQLTNASGTYAYRIQLISSDGKISYSAIQMISFDAGKVLTLQAISTGDNQSVHFKVNANKSGNYIFTLFNLNGNKLAGKSAQLEEGSQHVEMNHSPLKSGIYLLTAENDKDKAITKIMIL